MTAVVVRLITVAFVFGGSLFGIYLRVSLPKDHFGGDSKDVVKLGMGLVGMMAALVLGLLIASAKASHDTQRADKHVEQDCLVGPCSGMLRPRIKGSARFAARRSCPHSRSDGVDRTIRLLPIAPVVDRL